MWVVTWNEGIEAYGIAEDARFAYMEDFGAFLAS